MRATLFLIAACAFAIGSAGDCFADSASEAELEAIDSDAKGTGWFDKHLVSQVNQKCGTNIAFTIDWKSFEGEAASRRAVVGTNYCEQVTNFFTLAMCQDEIGKAIAKTVTQVECAFMKGKAKTNATTKIFMSDQKKHAVDLVGGKLTVKIGGSIAGGSFLSRITETAFPAVEERRSVATMLPGLQKHFTNWSENKDGVDFKVDIDVDSFLAAKSIPIHYICGGDGSSTRSYPEKGHLHTFLDTLYEKTPKGKALLKGVKQVTCAATNKKEGKVAEIKGDHLTIYFRILEADNGSEKYGTSPGNDAYLNYALFRKAKNLGGECPWNRHSMDKDPEADRLCPLKKK